MNFLKKLNRKQQIIFGFSAALLLIIIIAASIIYINRIGKIRTTVKYAPFAATITLNDTPVKNNSTLWLEPGIYKAKISFDHFETIEREIEISNEYSYIIGILSATDDEGKEYISSHKQEFIETEGLVGRALNEEGRRLKEKYPILNYLPINNHLYSISYAYNDKQEPIITIKTTPEYLDTVIQKMKSFKNVDLTAYRINFALKNPFKQLGLPHQKTPQETLKKAIDTKKYQISEGQYIKDKYFVATIYQYDYDRDLTYAHYRALLEKIDGEWYFSGTPQPLLTVYNTEDTPVEILNSTNSLQP